MDLGEKIARAVAVTGLAVAFFSGGAIYQSSKKVSDAGEISREESSISNPANNEYVSKRSYFMMFGTGGLLVSALGLVNVSAYKGRRPFF